MDRMTHKEYLYDPKNDRKILLDKDIRWDEVEVRFNNDKNFMASEVSCELSLNQKEKGHRCQNLGQSKFLNLILTRIFHMQLE